MNRRDFIKSAIIGAAGVSVPLRVIASANTYEGFLIPFPPAPDFTLNQEQLKRIQEYLCSLYDLEEESDTPIVSTQIVLNS